VVLPRTSRRHTFLDRHGVSLLFVVQTRLGEGGSELARVAEQALVRHGDESDASLTHANDTGVCGRGPEDCGKDLPTRWVGPREAGGGGSDAIRDAPVLGDGAGHQLDPASARRVREDRDDAARRAVVDAVAEAVARALEGLRLQPQQRAARQTQPQRPDAMPSERQSLCEGCGPAAVDGTAQGVELDRVGHRLVAGVVGMEVVTAVVAVLDSVGVVRVA